MGQWDQWIGRSEQRHDRLGPALATRWCAALDLALPDSGAMPQGVHFCLCTPDAPTAALGADGHPARDGGDGGTGGFLPPIDLPRRMWAASEIAFHAPIGIGAEITRSSRIASITEKHGASGRLGFVEIEHVTLADGVEAVREMQTLVYREAAGADAPLSPPVAGEGRFEADGWDRVECITPSEALLFRFSALTFNSHRIHYDTPYARDAERYRGLVVHGPLIATQLLLLASEQFGANRLARFAFRAVSPAIAGEALHLALRGTGAAIELGAFAADGRQVMRAQAALGA